MKLSQLIIRKLSLWVAIWMAMCLATAIWAGNKLIGSEYQRAYDTAIDFQRLQAQSNDSNGAVSEQAALESAKQKAGQEKQEVRNYLILLGLSLLVTMIGTGLIIRRSLRLYLDGPITQLINRINRWKLGDLIPQSKAFKVEEIDALGAEIDSLMARLKQEQQHNKTLLGSVLKVQESERQKIAQDLHDHLGQMLTSISVNAAFLLRNGGGPHHDAAQSIQDQTTDMMRWLRSSLQELKPHLLIEVSLHDAVLDLVDNWAKRKGWFTDFAWNDPSTPLSKGLAIALFRNVQEAMSNAARHAITKRLSVMAGQDMASSTFIVLIENDGVSESSLTPSLGLTGIEERVASFGGQARWKISQNRFTLIMTVPLEY